MTLRGREPRPHEFGDPEVDAARARKLDLTDARRGQIVRLLQTLDDGLPVPTTAPLSQLGFVHRAPFRESCPDCLANDRRTAGCEGCGGRGYVEGRRSRDPYDSGLNRGWLGAAAHELGRERDREIARLEAQTAPPLSEADLAVLLRGEGWELERRRRFGLFDYEALVRGLDALRLVDVDAYRAVHAVWIYGWLTRTSTNVEAMLERGLVFLNVWLPADLRAPAAAPAAAASVPVERRERDRLIRLRVKEGYPSQWVAGEFGLTVSQVNRVVNKEEDAA